MKVPGMWDFRSEGLKCTTKFSCKLCKDPLHDKAFLILCPKPVSPLFSPADSKPHLCSFSLSPSLLEASLTRNSLGIPSVSFAPTARSNWVGSASQLWRIGFTVLNATRSVLPRSVLAARILLQVCWVKRSLRAVGAEGQDTDPPKTGSPGMRNIRSRSGNPSPIPAFYM